ncbi:hypothetical protein IPG41_00635 [Candidatus Peregrinibacteria bacterium]|nr:MAG: hypothetical protein IPG41_00635 [Candidatus Peregrinibacteria bacterium]
MLKTDHLKQIQVAKSQKNYDLMLLSAKEALNAYPSDEDLKEALCDAQAYYVNEKLHSDLLKTLEEKEDWEGLQAIYLKLLSVFPSSEKLHHLLEKTRKKIERSAKEAKENFYQKAERQVKEMMQKGDLQGAENACYEILSSDPKQKKILKLLIKIQHRIDKDIEKALGFYYKNAVPSLEREYQAHQENYVRV